MREILFRKILETIREKSRTEFLAHKVKLEKELSESSLSVTSTTTPNF